MPSTLSALNSPIIIRNNTNANGSPMITTALCKALRPSVDNNATVTRPITVAQAMRIQAGASLDGSRIKQVRLDNTSEPESPDVTKNTIASIVTTTVVTVTQGRFSRNR